MKRLLLLALAVLPLSGCGLIHLGAKPNDFECEQAFLDQYFVPYRESDLIREIHRDVGDDLDPDHPGRTAAKLAEATGEDRLFGEMFGDGQTEERPGKPIRHILLLSGGGQWGAFGAGFLEGIRQNKGWNPPHFDVVTGVSTGAIQALFVARAQWAPLTKEYTNRTKPLAIPRSLLSVVFNGYSNDTAPLRQRLEDVLCPADGGSTCKGMIAIGEARTRVFIGMVEARTGDFKVVDVSSMIRDAVAADPTGGKGRLRRTASCVAGVTMASAAVPVQLRPVRLTGPGGSDPHTYTDGGVRLSVFESEVARLAEMDGTRHRSKVNIYVMRNGPTVVMPNLPGKGRTLPAVDEKPDAEQVGKMSYATLVNQNEVMSIAALRLVHPNLKIYLATADGYATQQSWRKTGICKRTPGAKGAFDIEFMNCLAAYGEEKGRVMDEPWIRLQPIDLPTDSTKAGGK